MDTVTLPEEIPKLSKVIVEPEPLTTKIYYNVDDQKMPYTTEIPIPPSKITLADFKHFINRRNYKFYYKIMDPVLKMEVKTDILNEHAVLIPNEEGRFELFLLSDNTPQLHASSSTASTLPPQSMRNQDAKNYRRSVRGASEVYHYPPSRYSQTKYNKYDNRHYFDDSSSQEESNLFMDSNVRVQSDDDSQSSTGFTSVSRQQGKRYDSSNKPCWSRNKRRRPKKSLSFLSSTLDDTEVSMALDLITVSFHMDPRLNFGMKVVAITKPTFVGIYVHEIKQGSIVAIDGRIKVGYLILEVDGVPLDQFELDSEKIQFLKNKVELATVSQGYLELTCVKSEMMDQMNQNNPFRLPPEPVRPIDPFTWVQHCNAMRESENCMSPMAKRTSVIQSALTNTYQKHNNLADTRGIDYNQGQVALPSGNSAGLVDEPRGPSSGVGSSIISSSGGRHFAGSNKPFHLHMDKLSIICAMADPINGLQLRRHGKADNSFLGSDMLSWLERNVAGLETQKACENFASDLVKERLILQAITKKEFTNQCYYTFNEEFTKQVFQTAEGLNTIKRGALTLIQNPALEISSFDELTMSNVAPATSNSNKLHFYHAKKPKKCKGGLRCVFRKLFCFHANLLHADRFGTHSSLYTNKNNQKLTQKNENVFNNVIDIKGKSGSKKKVAEKKAQKLYQHQQMVLCNKENSTHIP